MEANIVPDSPHGIDTQQVGSRFQKVGPCIVSSLYSRLVMVGADHRLPTNRPIRLAAAIMMISCFSPIVRVYCLRTFSQRVWTGLQDDHDSCQQQQQQQQPKPRQKKKKKGACSGHTHIHNLTRSRRATYSTCMQHPGFKGEVDKSLDRHPCI